MEILNRLSSTKKYSKDDFKEVYYRLYIKEGDE